MSDTSAEKADAVAAEIVANPLAQEFFAVLALPEPTRAALESVNRGMAKEAYLRGYIDGVNKCFERLAKGSIEKLGGGKQ